MHRTNEKSQDATPGGQLLYRLTGFCWWLTLGLWLWFWASSFGRPGWESTIPLVLLPFAALAASLLSLARHPFALLLLALCSWLPVGAYFMGAPRLVVALIGWLNLTNLLLALALCYLQLRFWLLRAIRLGKTGPG